MRFNKIERNILEFNLKSYPHYFSKSPLELIKMQTYVNCPNFPNQSDVYYNPSKFN